jgi:hypothetical protein
MPKTPQEQLRAERRNVRRLRLNARLLRTATEAFVDYYTQAGIGDAKDTEDGGQFYGDERFNVRLGREVLERTK